jgi:NTP pyrophosphatase (non-canonical NTP hydrolase)
MRRDPIEVIREKLPQEEVLRQLAEEAAEVAQAALKMCRAITGINPTPVTVQEAYEGLLEEIGDVNNCLVVLGYDRSIEMVRTSMKANEKLHRWADRLEGASE